MIQESTLSLQNGRRLGLLQFGAREGIPVFYFHGYPTSRLEALLMAPYISDLDIRLIALDRPGYGLSDCLPGRRILDWPDDVQECAGLLGIDRFSVVGVSGGGPYALACAYKIPEKLKKVSVVCGLGPLHAAMLRQAMRLPLRAAIAMVTYFPGSTRWLYRQVIRKIIRDHPELVLLYMNLRGSEKDKKVIGDDEGKRNKLLQAIQESVRNGSEGVFLDLWLYSQPWGFNLRDITLPVSFWHGEKDATVPIASARRQAEALPLAQFHVLAEEGHFSLIAACAREIFSDLSEQMV